MEANEVWYFAYGSNLNTGQMKKRVCTWSACRRAVLYGYKLIFNVESTPWKGLTANLMSTNNDEDKVYGVLYRLDTQKMGKLNGYEGVLPQEAVVDADGIKITAKVYIFPSQITPGRPPQAYLDAIITGLRQHGYSEEIVQQIRKAATN